MQEKKKGIVKKDEGKLEVSDNKNSKTQVSEQAKKQDKKKKDTSFVKNPGDEKKHIKTARIKDDKKILDAAADKKNKSSPVSSSSTKAKTVKKSKKEEEVK